jgi:hypothetical protein
MPEWRLGYCRRNSLPIEERRRARGHLARRRWRKHMKTLKAILRAWLPLAVAVTGVFGLVYVTSQQMLRMGANEPQARIAQDWAAALAQGAAPDSIGSGGKVDIAASLSTFVAVYDDAGKTVATSGLLHGADPILPAGVFDYTRRNGEDRVTWQPEPGVRIAAVVERYGGARPGFVVAGRSLRESERRDGLMMLISVVAWLATLAATFVTVAAARLVLGEKKV